MKRCHAVLASAAILLGSISALDAQAGGGGGHFGGHRGGHWSGHAGGPFPFFAPFDPRIMLGAALLAPLLYPPPPACGYYPEPVVVPPPVYFQYPAQPIPRPPEYWYFCASANLYHPYTQACPEGWQQIPKQPLF